MADKISASHDLSIASDHGIPTDDSRYYDEQFGIVSVDAKRWTAAQEVERKTWFSFFPHFTDDRSEEHQQRFNNYQALPMQCGDVLEIGCGPFTQSRSILNGRVINSLTLLDPLLAEYLDHPHCSYRDGKFYGYPVSLLSIPSEKLPGSMSFDLVICVNVLEHVQDAGLVIKKLLAAIRPGGYLVLGEFCHDDYHPSRAFKLAHPIMLKRSFFTNTITGLTPDYFDDRDNSFYLIAHKPGNSCHQ